LSYAWFVVSSGEGWSTAARRDQLVNLARDIVTSTLNLKLKTTAHLHDDSEHVHLPRRSAQGCKPQPER
jgi:hypothetical protein